MSSSSLLGSLPEKPRLSPNVGGRDDSKLWENFADKTSRRRANCQHRHWLDKYYSNAVFIFPTDFCLSFTDAFAKGNKLEQ